MAKVTIARGDGASKEIEIDDSLAEAVEQFVEKVNTAAEGSGEIVIDLDSHDPSTKPRPKAEEEQGEQKAHDLPTANKSIKVTIHRRENER